MLNKIADFKNLMLAARLAQRSKKMNASVAGFNFGLERELCSLKHELLTKAYVPGTYQYFVIFEPKKREIGVAPYRDRVVHHALCNIIEPIIDKRFIFDSYACRKNKGTHKAIDRCEQYMRSILRINPSSAFVLQCDIARFFPTVNKDALYAICEKHINDRDVLSIIKLIIDSDTNDGQETGIPIGNLTSQFFANMYLNELDQYVKHTLKERYYLRYMDDFLIFGNDKDHLWNIRGCIKEFLLKRLMLNLHPVKSTVSSVFSGLGFLGWFLVPLRDYPDIIVRRLKKENLKRFTKRIRMKCKNGASIGDIENSLHSWAAHVIHGNTYHLRSKIFSAIRM